MGTCCGTQEKQKELIDGLETGPTENRKAYQNDEIDEQTQVEAAVTIQKHFRGVKARRDVKAN